MKKAKKGGKDADGDENKNEEEQGEEDNLAVAEKQSEINKQEAKSDSEEEAADGGKESNVQAKKQPVVKRGQRSKLAKIKQKYKDQDEEDRELIMQYLAVSIFFLF